MLAVLLLLLIDERAYGFAFSSQQLMDDSAHRHDLKGSFAYQRGAPGSFFF